MRTILQPALRVIRKPQDVASRVLLTASTNVVLSVLALVSGALVARLLGPEGRGQIAAIQIWGLLAYRLATLGLPDSLVFFIARDPKRGERYLASATLLSLLAAVPVAALAWILMPYVLTAQPPRIVDAARLFVVLFVPLYAAVNFPIHSLRGQHDFAPWNALLLLRHVGWLLVLVVAWLIPTYDSVVVAFLQLASLLSLAIFNTWFVARRLEGRLLPEYTLWKPMLRFGLPSAITDASELVNLRVDQLVLVAILSGEQLGFYVAAASWGLAARPLLTAVGNVLFPRVAAGMTEKHRVSSFITGVRAGVALFLVLGVVLLALTPLAIPLLFGARFAPAVTPAFVLVAAGTLWGLNAILEEGLRGLGRPGAAMRAELAGAVITGLLIAILLPPLEIIGAAIASLTGFLVTAIVLLRFACKATGTSLRVFLSPTFVALFSNIRNLLKTRTASRELAPERIVPTSRDRAP